MRGQFPASDRCDFCKRKAVEQSDDGADLCRKCWRESVVPCVDCGTTMVWSVTIYGGDDGKARCQLCDGDRECRQEEQAACL